MGGLDVGFEPLHLLELLNVFGISPNGCSTNKVRPSGFCPSPAAVCPHLRRGFADPFGENAVDPAKPHPRLISVTETFCGGELGEIIRTLDLADESLDAVRVAEADLLNGLRRERETRHAHQRYS